MFRSGHFRSSHFASGSIAGRDLAPIIAQSIVGAGSGNARSRDRQRWRIKIGDVVYSTFDEDFLASPAVENDDEFHAPALDRPVKPVATWQDVSAIDWDSPSRKLRNIEAEQSAIRARGAIDRVLDAVKHQQEQYKTAQWQESVRIAQNAMVSDYINEQKRINARIRDDEEAMIMIMLTQ